MKLRHVTHSDVMAGAQHSQSPMDADIGGDGTSMEQHNGQRLFRFAHF